MKFLTKLEKKRDLWFLLIASFLFFLLRLPSLFEPYWYGDEGIYEVIGFSLRHGRLLYHGIWDNKPPLLYLLYAVFSGDQLSIRILSLSAGIVSLLLFYWLATKLYKEERIRLSITMLFGFLLGIPLLEGNIANAENFMMPIILGAALLTVSLSEKHLSKSLKSYTLYAIPFFLGFLLGIAFLFKVVAIFDLAAFVLFFSYIHIKDVKRFSVVIPSIIVIGIGFIFPFVASVLYFLSHHALPDYIHSAFLSNVGYVNYGNQFIIPQGLLILKLLFLGGFCLFLFIKRKAIPSSFLFIYLWLAFSLFNALFAQRPYTHYLLVLLASLCLSIGLLFKMKQAKLYLLFIGLLLFIFFTKTFYVYAKSVPYYKNFIDFIQNREDITAYRAFFDKSTVRDYELAEFFHVHARPTDTLFLWGNNGQVYKLTSKVPPGRYIVAYHVTWTPQTFAETRDILAKHPPTFIIVMQGQPPMPMFLRQYKQRLTIHDATIYEKIL